MDYISRWKLVMLFIYSCITIPVLMFMISLFFLWKPTFKERLFFEEEHIYISLNVAGIGFLLGVVLWLSYYLPYRKRAREENFSRRFD